MGTARRWERAGYLKEYDVRLGVAVGEDLQCDGVLVLHQRVAQVHLEAVPRAGRHQVHHMHQNGIEDGLQHHPNPVGAIVSFALRRPGRRTHSALKGGETPLRVSGATLVT